MVEQEKGYRRYRTEVERLHGAALVPHLGVHTWDFTMLDVRYRLLNPNFAVVTRLATTGNCLNGANGLQ